MDTPAARVETTAAAGVNPEPQKPDNWLSSGERGTLFGIRLAFRLVTLFGRWPMRGLVRLIALWYALFDRKVKASSRQWLSAVHERPVRWREVYNHVLRFTQVTLDRALLLQGKTKAFVVTHTGSENLSAARTAGRGTVLLGAHLGSFEAMRLGGRKDKLSINILGYFENARMINALFERLNPEMAARVIHIGSGSIDFIFRVQKCIAEGEFVAVLGDRVGLNEATVSVDFFGRSARFPAGPFTLAAVLKCPILLTFGIYTEPNRYDLYCEPFATRLDLPRKGRKEHLRAVVQRYAHRLEELAREHPDNWFNFYDFWGSGD